MAERYRLTRSHVLHFHDLLFHIHIHTCNTACSPEQAHDNIASITATVSLQSGSPIGSIKAHLFHTTSMRAIGPNQMWVECQAFDSLHDSKLDKIENFLANESFTAERQAQIDRAQAVLFIDQVVVEERYRGHGAGLWAIDRLIHDLETPAETVVLLQAGLISNGMHGGGIQEAHEKLTRHWKRLGFSEWSDSDDAWLLLWQGERPSIEEVMAQLRGPSR